MVFTCMSEVVCEDVVVRRRVTQPRWRGWGEGRQKVITDLSVTHLTRRYTSSSHSRWANTTLNTSSSIRTALRMDFPGQEILQLVRGERVTALIATNLPVSTKKIIVVTLQHRPQILEAYFIVWKIGVAHLEIILSNTGWCSKYMSRKIIIFILAEGVELNFKTTVFLELFTTVHADGS